MAFYSGMQAGCSMVGDRKATSADKAGFLSSAHDAAVIEATLAAAREAFKAVGRTKDSGTGSASDASHFITPSMARRSKPLFPPGYQRSPGPENSGE